MPDTAPLSSLRRRLDALPVEPTQILAAVLVAVVAAVAGVSWLAAGRGRDDGPPTEASLPMAGAAATEPAAGSAQTASEEAVVHVSGAVVRPGLVRLPPGARVADAVEAAGGAQADADLDRLNLAARVADGERVHVPRRGEAATVEPVAGGGGPQSSTGPLDLNTATAEQLDTLPGVGPTTARAIVEFRTRHGRFRSVTQLLEVRGIGPAKLAELRPRVRVS